MEFNKTELVKLRTQYKMLRDEYIEEHKDEYDVGWERKNLRPLEASFKRYVTCVKDYIKRRVIEYSDEFNEHYHNYYEEDVLLK